MIRRRTLSLFVIVCLGHVLLISAQVQSQSGLPVIEALAFDVFATVQRATAGVADAVGGRWAHYFALSGAARENADLRAEILQLQAQLQQQRALAARTGQLEAALALETRTPVPMHAARVIAGNPSPGSLTVTIDIGSADGVQPDMAVVGAQGVVGRVISPVAPHAATVQLLVGRNAAAAVVFERSRAGGVVLGGSNDGLLRAEYVPALADVQPGEQVTTSGQDGIFPPGFPVGAVERVAGQAGPDRVILVRPTVDFSHIDVVLVVMTRPGPAGRGAR